MVEEYIMGKYTYFFFSATPAAYESSWAKDWIQAAATTYATPDP